MIKEVKLSYTQLFLRFLKQNNVYVKYLNELTPEGVKRWEHMYNKMVNEKLPLHELYSTKTAQHRYTDLLWDGFMNWTQDNEREPFWRKIDNMWCKLCTDYKVVNTPKGNSQYKVRIPIKILEITKYIAQHG